jgi:hypothetical protein
VKSGRKDRSHSTTNHTIETKRNKSGIAAKLFPVKRVVGRILGLRIEDELSILGALLLGP